MRAEDMSMSFQGVHVRFRIYMPEGEISARALFVGSPVCGISDFDELCSLLSKDGCLSVVSELPGFGRSRCGAFVPQDNETRARILWGILDFIDNQAGEQMSKWHLVGHGSGCAAVLQMALYQPESTLSRAFICPVTDRFVPLPLHKLLTKKAGEKLIAKWHGYYIKNKKRFRSLAEKLYGKNPGKPRLAEGYRSFNREGTLETIYTLMKNGYTVPDEAFSVKGSVMLIWGQRDRIFGGEIPKRLLHRLPEYEIHNVNASHMPMTTNPDMIHDYLRGWFSFTEGRLKLPVKTKQAVK